MSTGAAASLVETALHAGVEICFANPGTTEMPIVAVLDRTAGLRVPLGLFEGVCTGAADGWARMKRKPAATLLHLRPGLANGLANLHNARRARTPVVNGIGNHAVSPIAFDRPLNSDVAALAGCVGWTRSVRSADEMAEASRAAVAAALGAPGRVASLLIPADCQRGRALPRSRRPPPPGWSSPRRARSSRRPGGCAAGLTAVCACPVRIEPFPARQECGRNLPHFPALPYFPEQATEVLAGLQSLVLAGARDPVAFFAEPDQPSRFRPEGAGLCTLADPESAVDAAEALEALAAELGAPAWSPPASSPPQFQPGNGPLSPDGLCRTLAALIPERAIVVNEATTTGLTWNTVHAAQAAPHTMLFGTGGAIGQGLPNALGAALASPDRRVIAFQAEGSGLYTLQALWSMVRENVDVTVVVWANRCCRILQIELARAGVTDPGPTARSLTDLSRPEIDGRALAHGFGVPACRVHSELDCSEALRRSFSQPGPSLIEAVLS